MDPSLDALLSSEPEPHRRRRRRRRHYRHILRPVCLLYHFGRHHVVIDTRN